MNLKTACWTEETRCKRAYAIWFHLYELLEWAKVICTDRKQINSCLGVQGLITKANEGMFCSDRSVQYFGSGTGYLDVYICQHSLHLNKVGLKRIKRRHWNMITQLGWENTIWPLTYTHKINIDQLIWGGQSQQFLTCRSDVFHLWNEVVTDFDEDIIFLRLFVQEPPPS